DVELAVGSEGDELPAVVPVLGETVGHHHGLGRIVEVAFHVVEAQDAVDGRDVEGASVKGDADGQGQAGGEGENLRGSTGLPPHRIDLARLHRAHEERA